MKEEWKRGPRRSGREGPGEVAEKAQEWQRRPRRSGREVPGRVAEKSQEEWQRRPNRCVVVFYAWDFDKESAKLANISRVAEIYI